MVQVASPLDGPDPSGPVGREPTVARLRAFGRLYTQRLGVLHDRFLGRDRPPGPTRLLLEIGPDGDAVWSLRDQLGWEPDHLDRVLRSLESEGLVVVTTDPDDDRRAVAALTTRGDAEWRARDLLCDDQAAAIVAPLSARHRAELADALARAEQLLRAATIELVVTDPDDDAARRALGRYFAELDERFPDGFDAAVGRDAEAEGLRAPRGRFVVALDDGEPVGCGGVRSLGEGGAEIKRMWIDRAWRGVGLGRRLLSALEAHAGELGHDRVRLDTNATLTEAIAMYRSHGYVEIERYNDNPHACHWFERRLTS